MPTTPRIAMSLRSAGDFFKHLIDAVRSDLHRIANSSNGEISFEELQTETWIAATELSNNQTQTPEPTDEGFRNQILRRLWKKFGRFADRHLKLAYRLDDQHETEDGVMENRIAASLQAPTSLEPEEILMAREALLETNEETRLQGQFAEAVAYVRVADHFRRDWALMALHLAIADCTLQERMRRARRSVEIQPSLFDGIESIPQSFMPPKRLRARPLPPPRAVWRAMMITFVRNQVRLFPGAWIPLRLLR